jgi:26S proteasome regulatory subunit N11
MDLQHCFLHGVYVLGVDINTQQSFEALSERAVAVVVDPIQSVKGKVVIDAFRLINPNMMVLGQVRYQFSSVPVLWIRKYFRSENP